MVRKILMLRFVLSNPTSNMQEHNVFHLQIYKDPIVFLQMDLQINYDSSKEDNHQKQLAVFELHFEEIEYIVI